jgi:hypothetical protein
MEFNNTDAKNIIGFADLMSPNNENFNPLKLEEEIINGMNAILEEEEDQVNQYKQEMERMVNDFNIEDFNQTDAQDATGGMTTGATTAINKNDVHNMFGGDNNVRDTQLQYMTLEQGRQNFVDDVLHDIGVEDNNPAFNIDEEEEEDDKNVLLEQIDMLRDSLEDDGVSLINVPQVTKSNSMSEIQNVYKVLRIKNDRNRYCSFAEELILSGAYGLEYLFDGKNEWLGRKPDLVGWSNTVRIKLRRCRFQTSTLIKDIMQDYNMGSGWQLLLELIPSMFLYSRQKKIAANDDQYDDAISQINSTME